LRKESIKWAEKELTKYTNSWVDPAWDEVDWQRLKELQVREIMEKRQAQADIVQSAHCLQCPDFVKHVSSYYLFRPKFYANIK